MRWEYYFARFTYNLYGSLSAKQKEAKKNINTFRKYS